MNLPLIFRVFGKKSNSMTALLFLAYVALGYTIMFRIVKPKNHKQVMAVWLSGLFWVVL